ncbi:GerAB/ArcD/ProY family transporter [Paenisporosarcina sp. TG20]|uniref:GerAB/ArcD/ProY family transporter n=1 Tax=Paenisporosarcina sp. TG20 TaxID=1211706 RepID=UPI0003141356|nr:GerAB/ArcD/ProY family transporter [Paenisporosarcina sp. TG20]
MDATKKKVLNGYHVVFLVQNVIIGTGLLSLNHVLSPVGYSQWWFPLLFGVIANITLFPMIWLALKYKDEDLFDINVKLLGKWIGKFINIILIVYALLIFMIVIQNYLSLIQITVLPNRAITFHLLIIMVLTVYIVYGGIKSIARFCIFTFFFAGTLTYSLRWGLMEGNISHLLPLFNFSFSEFMEAFHAGYVSMIGYELLMVYFPYIIHQKKVFKQASLGIWIVIFFYFSVSIVSVMYFSEWQLEHLFYPILQLFQAVKISIIERMDVIGITVWVFLILSTVSAYLWMAKRGIDSVRGKTSKYHLYALAIFCYIILSLPISQAVKKTVFENITYAFYGVVLWPLFLCSIHFLRKEKKEVVK